MTIDLSMSREARLRRVAILCCSFARNLAYYRVGRAKEFLHLLDPARNTTFNFWRAVNGNFIDTCVLEWCKLFADQKGKHHWTRIVTDADSFKKRLLCHIGFDEAALQKDIEIMVLYRDKFIAHLDSELTMNIPCLDLAKKAVWFYYHYVLTHETVEGFLAGLPIDIDTGFGRTEDEARAVYAKAG